MLVYTKSTTQTAQSIISSTTSLFEPFLVNNLKFIDINDAFHYMNTIREEDCKLDGWVKTISKSELLDRIIIMFYKDVFTKEYEEVLFRYIDNLSEEEIAMIYYKNNFVEFTERHNEVKSIYDDIFSSVKNYKYAKTEDDIPEEFRSQFVDNEYGMVKGYNYFVNNQYFMDPNSPPDTVINHLEKLRDIMMKYVYHPYLTVDRIFRLKYFERKTVVIVDTDSNIMTLDRWVEYVHDHILLSDYGRSRENNDFIIVNTMAYIISAVVADTLDLYGRYSNIPDDYRSKLNMKNELKVKLV